MCIRDSVDTEPRDADYQERNAVEGLYTDPLQMKEKSNTCLLYTSEDTHI